jgi:hypothetical protein
MGQIVISTDTDLLVGALALIGPHVPDACA